MDADDVLNAEVLDAAVQTMPLTEDSALSDTDQLRLQRILDYMVHAPRIADVLGANVACITGGLLKMIWWLEKLLAEVMNTSLVTPELLERAYQAMDMHLRLVRQVERFAQFERRADQSAQPGRKVRTRIEVVSDDEPVPAHAASEELSN